MTEVVITVGATEGTYSVKPLESHYSNVFLAYVISFPPFSLINIRLRVVFEALFATIQAFIEEGDEVILFEPFYDAYPADVGLWSLSFLPIPCC